MNIYKVSSYLKVSYLEGTLVNVERQASCDLIDWEALRHDIPFYEEAVPSTYSLQNRATSKDKIAIFCMAYKAWSLKITGSEMDYKVSRAESGMVKGFEFTLDLLRAFFLNDFWTKDKTISNYVKHYNEIQRIAAAKTTAGNNGKSDTMDEALNKWFG